MGRINAVREIWRPETKADAQAVLKELNEVLASPQFCNSKRYPALLRYVVEHTLAGRADNLKERTLGIEVFGRPATYDTSLDTVVRYTAGEIRKRLLLYYHDQGQDARIQIHLPAGSYVPEFICAQPEADELTTTGSGSLEPERAAPAELPRHNAGHSHTATAEPEPAVAAATTPMREQPTARPNSGWKLWVSLALLLMVICGALALKFNWTRHPDAVEQFWAPLAHEPGTTLVCLGGVVFEQDKYSGVITAGKDIDYPFVSMQIAASLPRVSQVLDREKRAYEIESAASTPITQMRDRPVVLLGAYNNEWTMRILNTLRYRFSPEPVESIFDSQTPNIQWSRDKSIPYSKADDYALVARFRDPSTDGFVVVLAGLGRNGSEAAAEFATSPHYMGMVRDRVGSDLENKNIEVVLKVNVFDGKTGAPSIVAVHTW
jgi:hypothetical protein